jgi:hypothetical protein
MIEGNQTWLNQLGQLQKQPLYALEIPGTGLILASFDISLLAPPGGYGVLGYGIGGYGQ